jgi:site-specific DNA-methyltransferase (cytosine-N4-specific)
MISPYYITSFGEAYLDDSLEILSQIPNKTIDLVLTSPPFALRRKKSYGNVSAENYCDWFMPFALEINRVLKPKGSFVLDIGGSWNKGIPTRSLYHFELLLELCKPRGPFHLAQEFYWYNPAKLPTPAQWVTIDRIRVKDAVNPIWWLSKSIKPKATNRRVLTPYSKSMEQLLERGYNEGVRPSGHNISTKWAKRNKGAIPPNIIVAANTRSNDPYLEGCKKHGLDIHPARFVKDVPEFFIKFLTTRGNTVLDPFAGSNMVGAIAENLERKWISIEINEQYVVGSSFRFSQLGNSILNELKSRK